MNRHRARSAFFYPALAAIVLAAGCISAPEIVLVDRATALEHQAASNFTEIERKLVREGIAAHPVPLTPDDLQALGIQPPPLVDEIDLTEADRVDALLVQRCIGESREGLLTETHDSCRTSADRGAAQQLVERVNRARQQLWRWQQSRQPKTPPPELRRTWRQAHLRGLVCGGWMQKDDASWEAKQC